MTMAVRVNNLVPLDSEWLENAFQGTALPEGIHMVVGTRSSIWYLGVGGENITAVYFVSNERKEYQGFLRTIYVHKEREIAVHDPTGEISPGEYIFWREDPEHWMGKPIGKPIAA
jgi:hypothetical protein